MNIHACFYAVEIADTGSFCQAARNLYVSQPNLSHAIKQLEQAAGFPLFVRTATGVVPTPEGADLIARFRILKGEFLQIQDAFEQQQQKPRLTLRVATLNASRCTQAFSEIIQQYIGSPLQFSFMNYSSLDALLPSVETCQMDFAVIGCLSPFQKSIVTKLHNHAVEYHPLGDFPVQAIVGPQNPLHQGSGPIGQTELYPYTLVQYSNVAAELENQTSAVIGLDRHTFGEINVNTSQLYYHILRNTPAFGLVTTSQTLFDRYNTYPELHLRPLLDCSVTAQFGWIKQRRYPLSDVAADLLQRLKVLFQ